MAKPRDPARYPTEYIEILNRASSKLDGRLTINFATESQAKAFRFDFYGWIKANEVQANELAERNPALARDYADVVAKARQLILSLKPPATIEVANRSTSALSQALREQGFEVTVPQLQFDSTGKVIFHNEQAAPPIHFEANPMAAFEAMMEKHGFVGAKKPEDKS